MEILPMDTEGVLLTRTMPKILCCLCGVEMESNPANMCVNCLRTQVDITEGIPKQVVIYQCRGCSRFLRPPWVACDLESRELLAICLKKINGLNKVKLVDAGFIWTEPHSRRIKVKLTIQKEVLNGVKLQQVFAVEFVIHNQQCEVCQRSYTEHTWRALVQVRQRVDHKKTFFLLEQLILKHNAHEKCINIEQVPNGVDFAFYDRSHAIKFIDFLASITTSRSKSAKQLLSEDVQNSFERYKFTYAVELVPLCKDDLVVVPAKTAALMGQLNPVCLVYKSSSHIFLVDPRSLQMAEMDSERYWKTPFRSLMTSSRLEEFVVLDVSPVTITPITGAALRRKHKGRKLTGAAAREDGRAAASRGGSVSGDKRGWNGQRSGTPDEDDKASTAGASSVVGSRVAGGFTGAVSLAGGSVHFNGAMSVASTVSGGPKGKFLLADAEVMKTREMGLSDRRYIVRTHLGNILRPGDAVMGYDLTNAVYNDADAETAATGGKSSTKGTAGRASKVDLPDIVLVRKCYPRRGDAVDSGLAALAPAAGKQDVELPDANGANAPAAAVARKPRVWKLKRLADEVPTTQGDYTRKGDEERRLTEFESFLRDIEEDPAMRRGINLYKDREGVEARARLAAIAQAVATANKRATATSVKPASAPAPAGDDTDEVDELEIGLEELLDDMTLSEASKPGAAYADPEDAAVLLEARRRAAAENGAPVTENTNTAAAVDEEFEITHNRALIAGSTIPETAEPESETDDL